jgi:hypothetical protein
VSRRAAVHAPTRCAAMHGCVPAVTAGLPGWSPHTVFPSPAPGTSRVLVLPNPTHVWSPALLCRARSLAYWECAILLRKLACVICAVFIPTTSVPATMFALALVATLALLAHLALAPYKVTTAEGGLEVRPQSSCLLRHLRRGACDCPPVQLLWPRARTGSI